mmetsp:Transcript_36235/g.109559  ORF Transcript_36235/g.109559 Transcript_36235/m.109559 type:complete len:424 (-) Transcript_36235:26-1297(-)
MPGLHSPAKLEARRLRALRRGFLTPHSEQGRKFVEVDAGLAPRVKVMAKSLEVHATRDAESHFARSASQRAFDDGKIDSVTLQEDRALHREANRAKHHQLASARCVGVGARLPPRGPRSSVDTEFDVVFDKDPWASYRSPSERGVYVMPTAASAVRCAAMGGDPAGPVVHEAGVQTDVVTPSLRVEAPPFCPEGLAADPFGGWKALVECQNCSIAILAGRLEKFLAEGPGFKRLRQLEGRHEALRESVHTLAGSLSSTVASVLEDKHEALFDAKARVLPFITIDSFLKRLPEIVTGLERSLQEFVDSRLQSACVREDDGATRAVPVRSHADAPFVFGDQAVLHGLQRSDYNGKAVTITKEASGPEGRVGVWFDGTDRGILVRPCNLRRPDAARVSSPLSGRCPNGHDTAERSPACPYEMNSDR